MLNKIIESVESRPERTPVPVMEARTERKAVETLRRSIDVLTALYVSLTKLVGTHGIVRRTPNDVRLLGVRNKRLQVRILSLPFTR